MKKLLVSSFVSFGLLSPAAALATTVYYQPTPYPLTATSTPHYLEGWVPSVYYSQQFQQNDYLEIGGWFDTYRSYLQFNLEGLPSVATTTLWLMPYDRASGSPTAVDYYQVTGSWDASMTWSTQPTVTYLGQITAPTYGMWYGVDITSLYNGWKDGTYTNYGLRLDPDTNNNNWETSRSSRYTVDDSVRPELQLDFTAPVTVPNFKLPLPGDLSWLVSTEPGGWDCKPNYQDTAHTGINYFSIDFPAANEQGDYSFDVGGSSTSSIPVIAAADGKVAEVGTNPTAPNGNYIVVDHDSDGDLGTGFSTRYLHLKYAPSLSINDPVSQGDLLGFMGNTGSTTGTDLHFGTRYDNSGSSTSTVQYVTNEGLILKSYQTECDGSGNYDRYYPSTNQDY
jgi:murein DD-endopeptidase MepM/ murein hydrolase activator NlpD